MDAARVTGFDRPRLSQEVARRLERAIFEGRLPPGQRLASERALSRELGVSRPVLREALQLLESRGLVAIEHGRGTFVADVASRLLDVQPGAWLRRHAQAVRHFYEARLAVEPSCAELAARRRSEADLEELRAIVARGQAAMDGGSVLSFIGADIDFHDAVARMSGNPVLYRMLTTVIDPDTDLRRVLHRLPDHTGIAHRRHVEILDAVARRDAEGAKTAMLRALEGALHDVARGVSDDDNEGVVG